ncbi:MAG: hypothetical protein D4R64_05895 [Porphyromonadaceae bacterium]|nr:MAG: hypothetical protein D4R64_05895 [Porphyromonadaceae bacterium]
MLKSLVFIIVMMLNAHPIQVKWIYAILLFAVKVVLVPVPCLNFAGLTAHHQQPAIVYLHLIKKEKEAVSLLRRPLFLFQQFLAGFKV